jgi:hypothetical protein
MRHDLSPDILTIFSGDFLRIAWGELRCFVKSGGRSGIGYSPV